MITQLTVFLENEKGRLAGLCRALGEAGINMHALNIADTAEFGVVRTLCDTPEKAMLILREQGWRAAVTQVLGVRLPNQKGSLADLLEFLDDRGVNVEYGYCFSTGPEGAIDVLKIEADFDIETELTQAGFCPIGAEEIYCIG